MKIILIHPGCFTGGGGKCALSIARAYREMGHSVAIINPDHPSAEMNRQFKAMGFQVYDVSEMGTILNYSGGPELLTRTFWLGVMHIGRSYRQIWRILKTHRPDVVMCNSVVISWIIFLIKRLPGVRGICFVRETARKGFCLRIQRICLNAFDVIAYISGFDLRTYRTNPERSRVVPDFFDIPSEKIDAHTARHRLECELRCTLASRVILYMGGSSKLKGWTFVKQLLALPEAKRFTFLIAGDMANNEKISLDHVVYTGYESHVEKLYAASDLLLAPAQKPHQLMPIFEAGYFGVPVITFDYEALHENAQDQVNAILMTNWDACGWLSNINALFGDTKRYQSMSQMAQDKSQSHSPQQVLPKLSNLLE